MSQDFDIPLVGTYDGAEYAAKIKGTVDALKSGHLGAGRPSYAEHGTFWAKQVNSTTTEIYFFDGTSDILQAIYNPNTHVLTTLAIPNNGVALGKLAQISTARILGRTTAGSGDVESLTAAQVMALLPDLVGDSGAGGVAGRAPAPGAGDAAANYFLAADGTWKATPSGAEPGMIADFGIDTAPSGWLACYGQEVSRSTYAALFAAIGTGWGAGNGSTTFNLPDLRGRVRAGMDDMGGVSANRLTGLAGGVNGDNFAAVGGAETHTLTIPEIPSHAHEITNYGSTVGAGTPSVGNDATSATTFTTSVGGGEAHNNVQPTAIVLTCIKT